MKTTSSKTEWYVWSPEMKVVGTFETQTEAEYWAKMFGGSQGGYWVSSN